MAPNELQFVIPVRDYDLDATLASGQAFRWRKNGAAWEGVIGRRRVRLASSPAGIIATTSAPCEHWDWLAGYLQSHVDLDGILRTFPEDPPLQASVAACRGLRLLRQDPWECLASFICSSTKQIVQIRQIVELLCERFGEKLPASDGQGARGGRRGEPVADSVFAGTSPAFAFPTAAQLAAADEEGLRGCKMGFRAPYVLAAARAVADGELDLERLRALPCEAARRALTDLPGVGEKIANCVLLFAYGFQEAFPVDVWVKKALRELYFAKRRPSPARLRRFVATHFGPNAGYAQQYLFHYMRTRRT